VELEAEILEGIIYAGVSILGYQSVISRAKETNARAETKEEIAVKEAERKSNKKFTWHKVNRIQSILWRGLDDYREKMNNNCVDRSQIHQGNDLLDGKLVSDIKRDYHQAMGKESSFLAKFIIEQIGDELNTYICDNGSIDEGSRSVVVSTIAVDSRELFLENIHKRCGYNSDILAMENKVLPFPVLRDIIEEILTHAEKKRIIRVNEEKRIVKKYRVSAVSPIKILKVIISSRRGSRK